ncbi:hypothetical protein PPERSA_07346 [Pseudocohnilembus persalinus]|uniref:Uncharacterized protein n=1 Tax=Pseudocohnilembus persalinus TaxID=266149 RepID=A0A0V0QA76_PSEPJ|nr:hypothetical protein PPERSA_07346 [Pseudocohnilembus persalinus]|eukprot:KRW99093.1 hypothetical protein PPERSA_07346 [Pseudocohnilembus persalinus]
MLKLIKIDKKQYELLILDLRESERKQIEQDYQNFKDCTTNKQEQIDGEEDNKNINENENESESQEGQQIDYCNIRDPHYDLLEDRHFKELLHKQEKKNEKTIYFVPPEIFQEIQRPILKEYVKYYQNCQHQCYSYIQNQMLLAARVQCDINCLSGNSIYQENLQQQLLNNIINSAADKDNNSSNDKNENANQNERQKIDFSKFQNSQNFQYQYSQQVIFLLILFFIGLIYILKKKYQFQSQQQALNSNSGSTLSNINNQERIEVPMPQNEMKNKKQKKKLRKKKYLKFDNYSSNSQSEEEVYNFELQENQKFNQPGINTNTYIKSYDNQSQKNNINNKIENSKDNTDKENMIKLTQQNSENNQIQSNQYTQLIKQGMYSEQQKSQINKSQQNKNNYFHNLNNQNNIYNNQISGQNQIDDSNQINKEISNKYIQNQHLQQQENEDAENAQTLQPAKQYVMNDDISQQMLNDQQIQQLQQYQQIFNQMIYQQQLQQQQQQNQNIYNSSNQNQIQNSQNSNQFQDNFYHQMNQSQPRLLNNSQNINTINPNQSYVNNQFNLNPQQLMELQYNMFQQQLINSQANNPFFNINSKQVYNNNLMNSQKSDNNPFNQKILQNYMYYQQKTNSLNSFINNQKISENQMQQQIYSQQNIQNNQQYNEMQEITVAPQSQIQQKFQQFSDENSTVQLFQNEKSSQQEVTLQPEDYTTMNIKNVSEIQQNGPYKSKENSYSNNQQQQSYCEQQQNDKQYNNKAIDSNVFMPKNLQNQHYQQDNPFIQVKDKQSQQILSQKNQQIVDMNDQKDNKNETIQPNPNIKFQYSQYKSYNKEELLQDQLKSRKYSQNSTNSQLEQSKLQNQLQNQEKKIKEKEDEEYLNQQEYQKQKNDQNIQYQNTNLNNKNKKMSKKSKKSESIKDGSYISKGSLDGLVNSRLQQSNLSQQQSENHNLNFQQEQEQDTSQIEQEDNYQNIEDLKQEDPENIKFHLNKDPRIIQIIQYIKLKRQIQTIRETEHEYDKADQVIPLLHKLIGLNYEIHESDIYYQWFNTRILLMNYYYHSNQLEKAREEAEFILKNLETKEIKEKFEKAYLLQALATYEEKFGSQQKEEEFQKQSLEIFLDPKLKDIDVKEYFQFQTEQSLQIEEIIRSYDEKKYEECLKKINKILEDHYKWDQSPSYAKHQLSKSDYSNIYYYKSLIYTQKGPLFKPEQALETLEKVVQYEPNKLISKAKARIIQGNICLNLGDTEKGINYLFEAIEAYAQTPETLENNFSDLFDQILSIIQKFEDYDQKAVFFEKIQKYGEIYQILSNLYS